MSEGEVFFSHNKIEGYEGILTGAHRYVPARALPPLVSSHIGFWNALTGDTPQEQLAHDIAMQKRIQRKAALDAYMRSVWGTISKKYAMISKLVPNMAGEDTLFLTGYLNKSGAWRAYADPSSRHPAGRLEFITFVFDWHGARATIRLQQLTEYAALNSMIDLSPYKTADERAAILSDEGNAIREMVRQLINLNGLLESPEEQPQEAFSRAYETIYSKIWNAFYKDILEPSKQLEAGLGEIFADFRGFVLGAPVGTSGTQAPIFQPPFWNMSRKQIKALGEAQDTDSTTEVGRSDSEIPIQNPEPVDWGKLIRRLWCFLTVVDDELDFQQHEFIACQMLGGRAIYSSALGAQPQEPGKNKRFPLYFFCFCNQLSSWQVGRLVERINDLGCIRLAANMKFDELRDAGYELTEIEDSIQKAHSLHDESVKDIPVTQEKAEPQMKAACDRLNNDIKTIDARLRAINAPFARDADYRIQRSQYYIGKFRQGLAALRISRIEGFQQYDEFVERRMAPAYGLIASLLAQFARIRASRDDLIKASNDAQAKLINVGTRNRNLEIQFLQTVGDYALWLILIPYYFGGLLVGHILGINETHPFASHVWLYCWALMFVGGAILHMVLTVLKNPFGIKTWLFVSFLFASSAVVGTWCYYDWLTHPEISQFLMQTLRQLMASVQPLLHHLR